MSDWRVPVILFSLLIILPAIMVFGIPAFLRRLLR